MKSILKIKYKLHHFVNILFYLIFFIIGYMLGAGLNEKIFSIINNFIN